jgi:hypothetical protein
LYQGVHRDAGAQEARFHDPTGLWLLNEPSYYHQAEVLIGDQLNHRVRLLTLADRQVSTVIGSGDAGFATGPALACTLCFPTAVIFDQHNHTLYLTDQGNHVVRYCRRRASGEWGDCGVAAGTPEEDGLEEGDARTARFCLPTGLALLPDGVLLVADSDNSAVRLITTHSTAILIGHLVSPSALLVTPTSESTATLWVVDSAAPTAVQRFLLRKV